MKAILVAAVVALAAVGAGAGEWQVTTASANSAHPTWCGGWIYFHSDREPGVPQIWGVSDQGEVSAFRVTNDPTKILTEPSWNCGAQFVAVQGTSGGETHSIYKAYQSTPPSILILPPQAAADNESPSYVGSAIAFHSDRAGQRDIYIMHEGGEDNWVTRLTTNAAADVYPAISPDGQWIAFASDRTGDFDIWVTGLGGEADTIRHVTATGARDSEPAWSPGGTHIAFARDGTGIVVVEVASRIEHQVTSNGTDSSPTWSPEGDFVAFTRRGSYDQIWRSDNLPPGTGTERASWGSIKALYR